MPTISVIVPIYKVEPYLRRCVDSILAQTFTDFELVLVDDGSPDGCPVICDEYAQKDSRIHVIHQKNGGLSAARNAGIDWVFANSDSEWITFIDSDDWVSSYILELMMNAVIARKVKICSVGFVRTDGTDVFGEERYSNQIFTPEQYYVYSDVHAIIACGKLYHRSLFQEVRYPIGKLHEDEYTTYKILFTQEEIAVITEGLYYYYLNPKGITSTWTAERLENTYAKYEQMEYFRANGYSQAYKTAVLGLFFCFSSHIKELEKSRTNKKIVSSLRRQFRKELIIKGNRLGITMSKYPEYYEKAFPFAFRVVRRVKKLLR